MHWGIKSWFWVGFRCYPLRSDLGFICWMFGSFLAFNENSLLIWMVIFSISVSFYPRFSDFEWQVLGQVLGCLKYWVYKLGFWVSGSPRASLVQIFNMLGSIPKLVDLEILPYICYELENYPLVDLWHEFVEYEPVGLWHELVD